jgi:hypothetical protein
MSGKIITREKGRETNYGRQGLLNICSCLTLFKSKLLSTNIKLTLHKIPIRSLMDYVCPAWEFAAEQHLQNKVLRITGNFSGAYRPANCMWRSKFRKYMTLLHNYAHNKQMSSELTKIQCSQHRKRRSHAHEV